LGKVSESLTSLPFCSGTVYILLPGLDPVGAYTSSVVRDYFSSLTCFYFPGLYSIVSK